MGIPSEAFDNLKTDLKTAIQDGLNKDIDFDFYGLMKIKVYKTKLPSKWDYDNELLNTGTREVPIGKNHEGVVIHNFDYYPHMLVGGVTRFGKTVFIKQTFYTLLMNQSDNIELFILDLKGGMEFGMYEDIPQVKKVASDLVESAETLLGILERLKLKQKHMRSHCRYFN